MKKLLALSVLVTMFTFAASAQMDRATTDTAKKEKRGHKGHGEKKEMMKDLNLSKEQMKAMRAAQQDAKAKMQALKAQENITVKEMKEKAKAIQEERKTKLKAILTPEQFAKLEAKMKEKRGGRKNKGEKEEMDGDVNL
jgi:periplasmic protein CpxP/Spy